MKHFVVCILAISLMFGLYGCGKDTAKLVADNTQTTTSKTTKNAEETLETAGLSSSGRQTYEPCTLIYYGAGGEKYSEELRNEYGEIYESWNYDKNGDVTKHLTIKYEYDSEKRTIRREEWLENELNEYIVYEYSGNTRFGEIYDDDGDLLMTTKATMNNKGLQMKVEYYDDEGDWIETRSFFYDEYGENIKMISEYRDTEFVYYFVPHTEKDTIDRELVYKKNRPVAYTWTRTTSYYDEREDVNAHGKCEYMYK